MTNSVDDIRKMLLLPRAAACAAELRRSAKVLEDHHKKGSEFTEAIEGNLLMASTIELVVEAAARNAHMADRLASCARFLLDMLQASNEEVEAKYGRSDTMEQAVIELRAVLKEYRRMLTDG